LARIPAGRARGTRSMLVVRQEDRRRLLQSSAWCRFRETLAGCWQDGVATLICRGAACGPTAWANSSALPRRPDRNRDSSESAGRRRFTVRSPDVHDVDRHDDRGRCEKRNDQTSAKPAVDATPCAIGTLRAIVGATISAAADPAEPTPTAQLRLEHRSPQDRRRARPRCVLPRSSRRRL
jgi:hypothetical protein